MCIASYDFLSVPEPDAMTNRCRLLRPVWATLWGLSALLLVPLMSRADPPAGQWQPLSDFSDEFDGSALDTAKWHPNNPQWKGRQPGYFNPGNVQVNDGRLQITMKYEPDFPNYPSGYNTYTTGAVKSKTSVLYGYFEARCKAMDSRGSSAFWFYNSEPTWWTEIDMFEIGGAAPGHEKAVHMNAHVFRTPAAGYNHWSRPATWTAPFRLADDFHVYGLQWTAEEIKYYVDGTLRYTLANTDWHQPLYLNFDSETMPDWFGLPAANTLPSTFEIDYIRAWQAVPVPEPSSAALAILGILGGGMIAMRRASRRSR